MNAFEIKGWCPGALRPMVAGDGLVVRVKPRAGRLSAQQARALAGVARDYGNGMIDLSSRANLQLRGVRPESHPALLAELDRLGLLDPDPEAETRRNIIVTPFWSDVGDGALSARAIAAELERHLAASDLLLPGKFGFAVDCGPERVLGTASADIRIERDDDNGLLVRADGAAMGLPVTPSNAVHAALALARWFVGTSGVNQGRGRMAAHIRNGAVLPTALAGSRLPVRNAGPSGPGRVSDGTLFAVAFGSTHADTLDAMARQVSELRLTPWRMIFLPFVGQVPAAPDLILSGEDPILRVEACPGAPLCPQALGETRRLARELAASVPAGHSLHVSGCAKGCARARAATLTIVATATGFDVVRNGLAADPPAVTGLTRAELTDPTADLFGAH